MFNHSYSTLTRKCLDAIEAYRQSYEEKNEDESKFLAIVNEFKQLNSTRCVASIHDSVNGGI